MFLLAVAMAIVLITLALIGVNVAGHGTSLSNLAADIESAWQRIEKLEKSLSVSGLVPPYSRPATPPAVPVGQVSKEPPKAP